ncbi:lysophospholipid acyltransferase LPEAT1-like isoform X1 [Gossypium australe]|uniref:Lysophospholipid acyltransferase LPEAT1-like isoform X1 n=1 Tax=Gossypium australe TaxID=47621 RepID=A0A5B6VCZ6_9ROSI|nr:lysophospholipid acyltransferase LPEAT1-like isoform X1 [Gossypium australe]
MGSELKDLNSKPAKTQQPDPNDDDASAKDDRPLLESTASSAAEDIQELEKKFAAFVRNDVYGSLGCGKLPLKEKLLLGIALVTLLPLRLLLSTKQSEERVRPGAIVSNHLSYLDVLYHMSSSFPSFVAKRESKSSDFKGVAGIVTDRVRNAHQNELAPMMLLFPEGTTTNGDFLLPFKTGAFLAGAPVMPVILSYLVVRHVVFLLCQFVNNLEVTRLPIYHPSQQEKDNPKLYANNVRKLMAAEGDLIVSDIGLAEKRIYLAALNGNNRLPSVLHQKND